jgi:hypothetical protein
MCSEAPFEQLAGSSSTTSGQCRKHIPSDLTFPAILPGAIKSHPPLWGSGAGMGRLPAGLPPVGRRPFHIVSSLLTASSATIAAEQSLSHPATCPF